MTDLERIKQLSGIITESEEQQWMKQSKNRHSRHNEKQAMKKALIDLNLPPYLASESSLGHCLVSADVDSEIGRIVLADPRFTTMKISTDEDFDPRGYIEHIVLA